MKITTKEALKFVRILMKSWVVENGRDTEIAIDTIVNPNFKEELKDFIEEIKENHDFEHDPDYFLPIFPPRIKEETNKKIIIEYSTGQPYELKITEKRVTIILFDTDEY